jgi:hypothetical protein
LVQHRTDLVKARGPEPGAISGPGPRGLGSYLASPTIGDQFNLAAGNFCLWSGRVWKGKQRGG